MGAGADFANARNFDLKSAQQSISIKYVFSKIYPIVMHGHSFKIDKSLEQSF
jgi:hypothetical protein